MKRSGFLLPFALGFFVALGLIIILSFKQTPPHPQSLTVVPTVNSFQAPSIPDALSFAGEDVPMHRQDVREKFDKEFLKIYFDPGNILYLIKLSKKYFPVIEERLRQNGVPEDFKYLCIAESNMQNWAVSRAGAVGYWQFMPATAAGYGLENNSLIDERRSLEKSTDAASKYFKSAHTRFGSWTAAAASFNCGMGGYNSRVTSQRSKNYFDLDLPEETNKYIHRILSFKYIIENAEKLGYQVEESERYNAPETQVVSATSATGNLVSFARDHGLSYKELVWYNPWIRGYHLPSNKKVYKIRVPEQARKN